ncbi:MAG TPA: helix-turn-helix transcriptional regulator [Solirubrobacteraceae bacterium]|nr:helix-turn-helix transcriptional regulator [Solirubrobacteraceae bacterium]
MAAERAGHAVEPVSDTEWKREYNGDGWGRATRVPAAPLRPHLRDCVRMTSEESLAERAGVSTRRIGALLRGEQESVSLVVADRLCVAVGLPLSLVYQDA